jgi:phosphoribosylamine--glycine ligase
MQAAAGEAMSAVKFSDKVMVGNVLCAEGYPTKPRAGDVISGLEAAQKAPDTQVFCAGVSTNDKGELVTSGGRVLVVVSSNVDPKEAIKQVNDSTALITWSGVYSRNDIGKELLAE